MRSSANKRLSSKRPHGSRSETRRLKQRNDLSITPRQPLQYNTPHGLLSTSVNQSNPVGYEQNDEKNGIVKNSNFSSNGLRQPTPLHPKLTHLKKSRSKSHLSNIGLIVPYFIPLRQLSTLSHQKNAPITSDPPQTPQNKYPGIYHILPQAVADSVPGNQIGGVLPVPIRIEQDRPFTSPLQHHWSNQERFIAYCDAIQKFQNGLTMAEVGWENNVYEQISKFEDQNGGEKVDDKKNSSQNSSSSSSSSQIPSNHTNSNTSHTTKLHSSNTNMVVYDATRPVEFLGHLHAVYDDTIASQFLKKSNNSPLLTRGLTNIGYGIHSRLIKRLKRSIVRETHQAEDAMRKKTSKIEVYRPKPVPC